MKALHIHETDGFEIVMGISEPVCDPMASKKMAIKKLGAVATHKEIITEMLENPVYFGVVKGQVNVSDSEAKNMALLLQKAQPNECITRGGETICNNRGRRWYLYVDGWSTGEIKCVGEALPDGAVWREDLSINQLRVINEQDELEKIAKLSPESRIEAANVEIEAAKRAAVIKRMESEVTDDLEGLDHARSWYRREATRIEKKYGLTDVEPQDRSKG